MQTTARAQFHISAWGGVNYSWTSIKDFASNSFNPSDPYTPSVTEKRRAYYRNSFFVGIKADIELADGLSLSTNLLLENTGFQENFKQWYSQSVGGSDAIFDSLAGKDIVRTFYISAPVHLVFAAPIGTARFLVGAGGYISCGLTGTSDFQKFYDVNPYLSDSIKAITFSNNDHFRSSFYHANRIDYGLSVMMGVQLRNRIFVEAILEDGFRSVFKDRFIVRDVNNQIVFSAPNKRRVVMIGVGYRFK